MRYSIMLQVVGIISFILVATAALFGWLQSRPAPTQTSLEDRVVSLKQS
ncbi:hypothetical protein IQ238_06620 [Pleurocapsales cyanobacterium LEGE 06147]|nr:hypothetical protein [Pleurocapsales cyanobacterium LEGE 06147]